MKEVEQFEHKPTIITFMNWGLIDCLDYIGLY